MDKESHILTRINVDYWNREKEKDKTQTGNEGWNMVVFFSWKDWGGGKMNSKRLNS